MRCVDKNFSHNEEIDPAVAVSLTQWYIGEGDTHDHRIAVQLMRHLRQHKYWIACSCNKQNGVPPLATAALLTVADTFYLRRLTGPGRTPHNENCPFFREQQPPRIRNTDLADITIKKPVGYFSVVKPEPEKLAQKPSDAVPDDRPRQLAIPKMAKLLWMLMEDAGSNFIPFLPISGVIERSMATQYHRLKTAAKKRYIAPRRRLSDYLYTHPEEYLDGRIPIQLEYQRPTWPAHQEPQAFLLNFVDEVTKTDIIIRNSEARIEHIQLRNPSTKSNPAHGPYLTISVIGRPPYVEEYCAIQGYVQPIYSGTLFMPTANDMEREIVTRFLRFQHQLHEAGISISLRRPLFDKKVGKGSARPNYVIKAANRVTRRETTIFLEHFDSSDEKTASLKLAQQELLAAYGKIITYDEEAVSHNKIEPAILDALTA